MLPLAIFVILTFEVHPSRAEVSKSTGHERTDIYDGFPASKNAAGFHAVCRTGESTLHISSLPFSCSSLPASSFWSSTRPCGIRWVSRRLVSLVVLLAGCAVSYSAFFAIESNSSATKDYISQPCPLNNTVNMLPCICPLIARQVVSAGEMQKTAKVLVERTQKHARTSVVRRLVVFPFLFFTTQPRTHQHTDTRIKAHEDKLYIYIAYARQYLFWDLLHFHAG